MKLSKLSPWVLLLLLMSAVSCNGQKSTGKTQDAILETQMFKVVQEAKLKTLKADKKVAMSKVKNGDKAAEQQLQKLASTEKSVIQDLGELSNINMDSPIFKVKPTPPPCPPVIECENIFDLNLPLVLGPDLSDINVAIFDIQGNEIGGINKDMKTMSAMKVYNFKLDKKYKGVVDIKVKRIPKKGKPTSYTYRTKI